MCKNSINKISKKLKIYYLNIINNTLTFSLNSFKGISFVKILKKKFSLNSCPIKNILL